jgi:cell division protein FtsQ
VRSQRSTRPAQTKKRAPQRSQQARANQASQPTRQPQQAQQSAPAGIDYKRLFGGQQRQSSAPVSAQATARKHWREQGRSNRKRTASAQPADGSQVQPGTRRRLLTWIAQGRLVSLLLFLASVGCLVYLFTSPDLHVRSIGVEGNRVLPDAQVAQLSGLQGLPIWFIDSNAVLERLYQNAYIEEATLEIALPDQVTLKISERRPEVRWQIGNVQYLVDASGKVLDQAQEPPEEETLVILDTGHAFLQPNDQVDPDAVTLASALALRLPVEVGLTPTVIGWDLGIGVYVKTSAEQTIIFGRTENLERKLLVLQHLLTDQTPFTYLDLRPSNPFYR